MNDGARDFSGKQTFALGPNRFGPRIDKDGVEFRLWAPNASQAQLILAGTTAPIAMVREPGGFWSTYVSGCNPGARYKFSCGGPQFPDLASRQQDGDAAGWSVVCLPFAPSTTGKSVRPWHEMLICEVHVGTATPEGTFAGLAKRLEHFRDAGYTCLEIMPVNEFPGTRNWGYDGTLIFAPDEAYGTPADLRLLVDRAHELGICMILDVVYNHFGETDNFVSSYAPEWFDPEINTPWGPGIDFTKPFVRQFYYENACMWLNEYDFDGLRFDSVHEIKTEARDLFLGELAACAQAIKPDAKLIIENAQNSFRWLERDDKNQPMTFLAQWNDDMHHVLDYLVTGEGAKTGYDDRDKDPYADLEKALADGFVHDPGEGPDSDGTTRGGPGSQLPPDSFITFLQNHDQIGNRADAKRLPLRTSPQKLDFAHFVKCIAPQIPLCFMGDEFNAETPFPFFFDLPDKTAKAKQADRYKQMREIFQEDVADGALPDPNDLATFNSAKLAWEEFENDPHRQDALSRFRVLAKYRRDMVWPLTRAPCLSAKTARQGNCLIVNWVFEAGTLTLALNPTPAPADLACVISNTPVSTGDYSQHGEVLRLSAWSAVAWASF